jgi:hypothetical protein
MRTVVERGGGTGVEVGGPICIAYPVLGQQTMLNRATPIAGEVDLDAIEAFFRPLDMRYAIAVTPERAALAQELDRRGYDEGYAWMKFAREAAVPEQVETDLRVEEIGPDRRDALDLVVREAFDMPAEGARPDR